MKRFLIPLLAALALPTPVNANYLCTIDEVVWGKSRKLKEYEQFYIIAFTSTDRLDEDGKKMKGYIYILDENNNKYKFKSYTNDDYRFFFSRTSFFNSTLSILCSRTLFLISAFCIIDVKSKSALSKLDILSSTLIPKLFDSLLLMSC